MKYLTQGSGTWVADNSDYQSDSEPIDAYATEWTWGIGNQSLTGRLYGIKDGSEVATYWEFRTFWNPIEDKVYTYQFGHGGAIGKGEMTFVKEGVTRTEQMFYYPDGSVTRIGHESKEWPGIHKTQSFNISENGDWIKRRLYKWKLKVIQE